jgi:hypothetical protein
MIQAEKRKAAIEKAKVQQYYQTDRVKAFHVCKNFFAFVCSKLCAYSKYIPHAKINAFICMM